MLFHYLCLTEKLIIKPVNSIQGYTNQELTARQGTENFLTANYTN
jgi:hypothetical protein